MFPYRGSEWEETFLSVVGKAVDNGYFKHIFVARFASRTLDHELERNTRSVIPYFTSTFVLMAAFRYISFLNMEIPNFYFFFKFGSLIS